MKLNHELFFELLAVPCGTSWDALQNEDCVVHAI